MMKSEEGKNLLMQLFESVRGEGAVIEREPRIEGRNMIMILSAKQSE